MRRPPQSLPFDKSKKKGIGDASAITKMKKVGAEVQDFLTKSDFTRKTLGGSTSSGFIWSLHQSGLSNQYNTLLSGSSVDVGPPGDVRDLAAGTATNTQMDLSWAAPLTGTVTAYTVEYKTAAATDFIIASSTVATTSYRVSGLTPNTAYSFRVTAYNNLAGGNPSSPVSKSTVGTAAMGTVTAGSITVSAITLTWAAPAGSVDAYRVEYKLAAAGSYTTVNLGNVLTYEVTGLTRESSYNFRVTALYLGAAGATSGVITSSTAGTAAMGTVTAGSITFSAITINWARPSGFVDAYRVEYKTAAAGSYTAVDVGNVLTYEVASLSANTSYNFRVYALYLTVAGTVSNVVTRSTIATSAVRSLAAGTATNTGVPLNWLAPLTGTTTRYTVEYSSNGGSSYSSPVDVGNVVTYTVGSLTPNTGYLFIVTPFNVSAAGTPSSPLSASTVSTGAMGTVTAGSATSSSVPLSWSAPAGTVDNYRVEYKRAVDPSYTTVETGNTSTSYTVTGLTVETAYNFRVTASYLGVYGTASTVNSSTTPAAVVQSMTTPIVSTGTIRADWTTNVPFAATVSFYDLGTTPAATGGTQRGTTVSVASGTTSASVTGVTTTINNYYRADITVAGQTYSTACALYTESYDVFAIMGQSNSVGFGADVFSTASKPALAADYSDALDGTATPGIKQWRRKNLPSGTDSTGEIMDAIDILQHNDDQAGVSAGTTILALSGGNYSARRQVGFGYSFAKAYKLATGRDVLLVPCGKGGSSSTDWASGGGLWNSARDRVRAAVYSKAGNRLCGVLWHQGETDVVNSVPSATYTTNLGNIISSFRTAVTTAASPAITPLISPLPWIIGELVPFWVDDAPATRPAFNTAIKTFAETAATNRAWVSARAIGDGLGNNAVLTPNDTVIEAHKIHYNAASQRIFGTRYLTSYNTYGGALTAPAAIGVLTAGTITNTSVDFTWAGLTAGTFTNYVVEYSSDAGVSYIRASALGTTASATVSGLASNASYRFRVTAYNGLTAGTARVQDISTNPTGSPVSLTAGTITNTSVILSWSAPTGTVTRYGVRFSSNGGSSYSTEVDVGSSTTSTVSSLTPSTPYIFRVIAYNGSSPSSPTDVSASTVSTGAMGTVTVGAFTSTTVPLSWSAPAGTVDNYRVEYKLAAAPSYTIVETGNTSTSYTVTGLTATTAYNFRVTASYLGVYGVASTVVNQTTAADFITSGLQFNTVPSGSTVTLANAGSRVLALGVMSTTDFTASNGSTRRMLRPQTSVASVSGDFPAGSYSQCCWVYFDNNPTINPEYTNIFSTSRDGNAPDGGYHHYMWLVGAGSGGAGFRISGSIETGGGSAFVGGLLQSPASTNVKGTWIHVAITYEQITTTSNALRLYINGAAVSGSPKQATLSAGGVANNAGILSPSSPSIFLGGYFNGAGTMTGYLDDVRLYNRALSAGEVSQIYNRTG